MTKKSAYNKQWRLLNKDRYHQNKINYLRNRDNGLYARWRAMFVRCKSGHIKSKYYSDRGIKLEWKSYQDFKRDMLESFLKHLSEYGRAQTTLDRIDNDGNYCKENCRWATMKVQASNRRKTSYAQVA